MSKQTMYDHCEGGDGSKGTTSAETRPGMCARDALLRDRKFKLEHRKEGQPAIWSRAGQEFSEMDALAIARKELKK